MNQFRVTKNYNIFYIILNRLIITDLILSNNYFLYLQQNFYKIYNFYFKNENKFVIFNKFIIIKLIMNT